MPGQEKFQIVSAGKVLRSRNPDEVLAQMSNAFSISAPQARKLFLKGWVIKDELSPGQVVQYRTQLHQMGLKIEVHPAGKFDNRAILARLKFAKQRQERKTQPGAVAALKKVPGSLPEGIAEKATTVPLSTPATGAKSGEPTRTLKTAPPVKASAVKPAPEKAGRDTNKSEQKDGAARAQLQALFYPGASPEATPVSARMTLIPQMLLGAAVPAGFVAFAILCLYQLGSALLSLPLAVLAGEFGAGTLVGSAIALTLVLFVGALVLHPFFFTRQSNIHSGAGSMGGLEAARLAKRDAPGFFLLLDVLRDTCGLSIASKQRGPRNLTSASGVLTTEVLVTAGTDIRVVRERFSQPKLSLGLGAVATLDGGDLVALIARALCNYSNRWLRTAQAIAFGTFDRLQGMQDALEEGTTLFGADGEVPLLLKPLHKVLAICGRPLAPVVERLQGVHQRLSGPLARRLEAQADKAAGEMIGAEAFHGFAERWNRLLHADLVCGEINREAQLLGKRLANVPLAVRWMYANMDAQTLKGIDAAMAEETDCWTREEPAGHQRIGAVEERQAHAQLQRLDFSLQKLFVDFTELATRVSRVGGDDSCRPVENRLLLEIDKSSEAAQQVLAQYFNRAIPRDFMFLQPPGNSELADLDLQASIDWLRGRLVDLQELEQRIAQLQLKGARIQIGAALVRANVRIDPRSYDLSGTTPAATDESRQDNRVRIKECLQQRQQLHSMFYQRITRVIATMVVSDRSRAEEIVLRLRTFEVLREPLAALNRYNDVVCELIERAPAQELPTAVLQKYPQLVSQQIRQIEQGAQTQQVPLSPVQFEKLKSCGEGELMIPTAVRTSDMVSALQALELRGKTASGVVMDAYQEELAQLLTLCLAEEARLKVKPLRLAHI